MYLRFKKYLNAGYPRTFICSVLNAFDIKVEKDRIFKKCLNAGYARTFIYSVLNAFDAISAHQDQNYFRITKCDRDGLQSAIGLKITKYDRAGLQITIGFGLQNVTKIQKNGLQSAMGLQSATDFKVLRYRCQQHMSNVYELSIKTIFVRLLFIRGTSNRQLHNYLRLKEIFQTAQYTIFFKLEILTIQLEITNQFCL